MTGNCLIGFTAIVCCELFMIGGLFSVENHNQVLLVGATTHDDGTAPSWSSLLHFHDEAVWRSVHQGDSDVAQHLQFP